MPFEKGLKGKAIFCRKWDFDDNETSIQGVGMYIKDSNRRKSILGVYMSRLTVGKRFHFSIFSYTYSATAVGRKSHLQNFRRGILKAEIVPRTFVGW